MEVATMGQSGSELPLRTRLAVRAGTTVSRTSRRLGRGEGAVVGGKVSLALDPGAVARLAVGHRLALVSGTNGKTTTTRLLAAALATAGDVISNAGGANLPTGIVTALWNSPPRAAGALEVDEAWLPVVAAQIAPENLLLVMLNLTRDQLDRVSEVRHLAIKWRRLLERSPISVVANADDPLVAWAAMPASDVVWIAAGQPWRADAVGCPACDGRLLFEGGGWRCQAQCGLARPDPDSWLEGNTLTSSDGSKEVFELALPGRFNRANAAMAAIAARRMGVDLGHALAAMAEVGAVSGRYQSVFVDTPEGRVAARLLLAKNPAGWAELLDLLDGDHEPLLIAINARIADGRDTSWLWDVPFERLVGRFVVASGERWRDMAVRLRYAGVDHAGTGDLTAALAMARAASENDAEIDVVANYTAFQVARRSWKSLVA